MKSFRLFDAHSTQSTLLVNYIRDAIKYEQHFCELEKTFEVFKGKVFFLHFYLDCGKKLGNNWIQKLNHESFKILSEIFSCAYKKSGKNYIFYDWKSLFFAPPSYFNAVGFRQPKWDENVSFFPRCRNSFLCFIVANSFFITQSFLFSKLLKNAVVYDNECWILFSCRRDEKCKENMLYRKMWMAGY